MSGTIVSPPATVTVRGLSRILSYNARDYGAVGDGVADDSGAINAALSAANSAGGGVVFVPQGTYRCASSLTLFTNIRLVGAGQGTTTLKAANSLNTDVVRSNGFAALTNAAAGNSVLTCVMGVGSTSGLVGGTGWGTTTGNLTFTGGGGSGATGTWTSSGGAITSVSITAAGTGYTTPPTIGFTGAGTGASVNNTLKIVSIAINNGGSGFTSAPSLSIGGGHGFSGAGTCTISGGVINSTNVTNAGSSYTTVPLVAATGGIVPPLGVTRCTVEYLTVDGNKSNNSSGNGISIYGYDIQVTNVEVKNCVGDGLYTEWSLWVSVYPGASMEALFDRLEIHDCNGAGHHHMGPHDSLIRDCIWYHNVTAGLWVDQSLVSAGASVLVTQCHSWGSSQVNAYLLDATAHMINCVGEGGSNSQVLVRTAITSIIGGLYFMPPGSGAGPVGIQIGATLANQSQYGNSDCRQIQVQTHIENVLSGAIAWVNSSGYNDIDLLITETSGGVPTVSTGNPTTNDTYRYHVAYSTQSAALNSAASIRRENGSLQFDGHLLIGTTQTAPTAGNGTNATGSALSVGNDTSGTITGTTIASPAAGTLLTLTFGTNYAGSSYRVNLTPGNAVSAACQPYVTSKGVSGFTISSGIAATGTQAISYDYQVFG